MFFTNEQGIITHYFDETAYVDVFLGGVDALHGLIAIWSKCNREVSAEQIVKTTYAVLGEIEAVYPRNEIHIAYNSKGEWFASHAFTLAGFSTISVDAKYSDEQIGEAVSRALEIRPINKYSLSEKTPQKTVKVDFERRGKIQV